MPKNSKKKQTKSRRVKPLPMPAGKKPLGVVMRMPRLNRKGK